VDRRRQAPLDLPFLFAAHIEHARAGARIQRAAQLLGRDRPGRRSAGAVLTPAAHASREMAAEMVASHPKLMAHGLVHMAARVDDDRLALIFDDAGKMGQRVGGCDGGVLRSDGRPCMYAHGKCAHSDNARRLRYNAGRRAMRAMGARGLARMIHKARRETAEMPADTRRAPRRRRRRTRQYVEEAAPA